jgi:hypothetical protein
VISPTLALEELMTHPRYPEVAARLRALLPGHILDQADAAVDETLVMTKALAALLGARSGAVYPDELPGWLRLVVLDAWVGYVTGRARTCRHNPSAASPRPVFAAAWKPDLITCAGCIVLLSLRKDSAADRTCDACGHCCAGVDDNDGIYPALIQLGPMTFQYGTCIDCRQTPVATPAVPRQRPKPRGTRGRGRGRP